MYSPIIIRISKTAFSGFNSRYVVLLMLSFLLPFVMSIWQLVDADFGRQLLSPFAFSDAALYHYSAWYKSVFLVDSYVSEIIVFSPYERLLTQALSLFGYSAVTPFVLNAIFSGLTCVMIVTITWQLFTPRSAWLALLIYCFATPILFFTGLTLKTGFVVFLTTSAILLGVLFFKRRAVYLAIGFSLLILLASVDRIHVLVGLVIFFAFLCWPSSNHDHARRYRFSALAIVLVMVSAFLVSSLQYGAEPKYVSNVGLNIYLGHSKPGNFLLKAKGVRNHIIGHRVDSKRLAERHAQRELSQAEVTQYWLIKTWDYIKTNPVRYLDGQRQKLHHLFAAQSNSFVSERANLWRGERWPLTLTFIDFSLVFGLFCVAVVTLFKRGGINRQQGFLLVFCVTYLLSGMATIVIERYRMVALVCMIPMAAWAVVYLCENIKERWYLLAFGVSIFACSQLLAYTAPANYFAQFDRHLSLEKKALNGRNVDFYKAKQKLETELNFAACSKFQRELGRNKFGFDVQKTKRFCRSLNK